MKNKKFVVIESRKWSGLFSNFFHTLQHLYRSDYNNRIPIINWRGGCYTDHEQDNVWEYYFEPVSEYTLSDINLSTDNVKRTSKYLKTGLPSEPKYCWHYKRRPPQKCLYNPTSKCRTHVNSIINKHVRIKPSILNKINTFYNQFMRNKHILGVHLRSATDLPINNKSNPLDRMRKHITQYLQRCDCIIYVATDCLSALDDAKEQFGSRIIWYHAIRSENKHPVQYGSRPDVEQNKGGRRVGEDALIECFLLSRCNAMIHGISNLSACAGYFNPELELIFCE